MPLAQIAWLCLFMPLAPVTQDAGPNFDVSLVDLHSAFADVEFALQDRADVDVNYVNRITDGGLLRYLGGNRIAAVRNLRQLALEIRHGTSLPAEANVLLGLKVVMDPPVFVLGEDSTVLAQIGSMFAAPPLDSAEGDEPDLSMLIRVMGPDGSVVAQQAFLGKPEENNLIRHDLSLAFVDTDLAPGRYTVEVESSTGMSIPLGSWHVVSESPDEVRADLLGRLDTIEADPARRSSIRYQALVSARARASRLSVDVARAMSLHTRFDLQQLLDDVRDEVGILEKQGNPFGGRTGHLWRSLRIGEASVAVRFYVPEVAQAGESLPLVIALHGVTGNESLFPDVYGAGALTRLADEHGFIVVAPNTLEMPQHPMSFDLLVSEVAANYAVDFHRVYLIGHASGTEAVDTFCRARTNRIAAACIISSDGLLSPRSTFPPLLLAHGWLDLITDAEKVEKLARIAASRNIPAQFLGVDHFGHVLVVGHALPSIVEWLLQHESSD